MTEKPSHRMPAGAKFRATRLGMGSRASEGSVDVSKEEFARVTRSGLQATAASGNEGSEDEREVGSRPGFDVRMPPREPGHSDLGGLEPRAVSVSKTSSARVFLKPGELPEWMGRAAGSVSGSVSGVASGNVAGPVHSRRLGTFMSGSPTAAGRVAVELKSKAPPVATARYGSVAEATYAKAPMTTSPAPAPFRRPLAYRPPVSQDQLLSGSADSTAASMPASVVYTATSSASSQDPAFQSDASESRTSEPSVPPLSLEMPANKPRSRRSLAPHDSLVQAVKAWVPRVLGVVVAGAVVGAVASLPVGNQTRAPGVLRPALGAQTISASSTGTVVKLLVQPGAQVTKGQPLLRIESLQLDVNAERNRRELGTLQEQYIAAKRDSQALAERRSTLVSQRRALLQHRLRLKEDELVNRRRRVREIKRQFEAELVAPIALAGARAALQATSEGRLRIDTEISALDLQQSEQKHRERQQRRQQELQLATAEARAKDAERLLALSVVTAPVAGWVEAVSVTPGAVVQPGTAVARLIPEATPTTIVAFVPADESSEVQEGADGTVRFDSFQGTDANDLGARIVRVSREVALPARVEALLGVSPAVPMVRVELELLDEPDYYRLQPLLRSGSPVVVSMNTVERRLIDIFWNSLEHWLN